MLLGCAGTLLPRGGGAPRSQRVDGGSTSGPQRRRRRGRAGPKLLRAREDSWRPDLSRGRSVRRPRRLFSAERGAGGRSSRRSPDLGLSSCGRRRPDFRLLCKWLNRKVVIRPGHAPCAHAWDLSRDWARPWEGLMGEPVRQEARTCSFALGRTAWPARCADVSHARASRRARPSRSRRPAFGAGGEEALACGGRRGWPPAAFGLNTLSRVE